VAEVAEVAVAAEVTGGVGATLIYLSPAAGKVVVATAIAAGVALLLIPTPAHAHTYGRPPAPIVASVPRFDLLYPREAQDAAVGRVRDLDGGKWVTVAVIRFD